MAPEKERPPMREKPPEKRRSPLQEPSQPKKMPPARKIDFPNKRPGIGDSEEFRRMMGTITPAEMRYLELMGPGLASKAKRNIDEFRAALLAKIGPHSSPFWESEAAVDITKEQLREIQAGLRKKFKQKKR